MTRTTKRRNELRRSWTSARVVVVALLLAVAGFVAVCAAVMLEMRRSEEGLARQTSENLASTIDADVARNIELYDLSLRAVATNLQSPEINGVSRELRHLILFDHTATAKHFAAIQVFDSKGDLAIDAASLDPQKINVATDEYFAAQRDNADADLFISKPRLHRGAYSIVLSRRISDADGHFMGVVAGAIRFSYFHDLFDRLTLGQQDSITLLRRDGTIIMRTPFDLDVIGRNIRGYPIVEHVLTEPTGAMSSTSPIDGIERMYVWRDNSKPLVVVVGRPWDDIYGMWRRQAWRIGLMVAALIALAVTATLLLAREITRRARAERRLEWLATTDALTGLRNRRKFDAVLMQEWRRAGRAKTPLALLMIDADHFKAFNDRFGHPAGDTVLAGIAQCIAASARRAGDCAARYGGEEFALLLPGLDAAAAAQTAEAIRRAVRALPALAPISVSIGVASVVPAAGMHPAALIKIGDGALYSAKASGRDRVSIAASPRIALVA